MRAGDFARGEVQEGPRTPAPEGLTAADYASGLRALADVIEAGGLPADAKYPLTTLGMNLYVSSASAVHDWAAAYGLTAEKRDGSTHTTASLVLGPNPDPYHEGSVELTVVHIDDPDAQEPEPDGVVIGIEGTTYEPGADSGWWECPREDCTFNVGWTGGAADPDEEDPVLEHMEYHRTQNEATSGTVTLPPADEKALVDAVASTIPTIPSDGAPASEPAPSDGTTPSLVRLDQREKALELVAEKAIVWADTDPDRDEGLDTERELLAAIAVYRAVRGR